MNLSDDSYPLYLKSFDAADYQIYLTWFDDEELRARISITPAWFGYVTSNPDVLIWTAYKGDNPISVIQVDAIQTDAGARYAIELSMNPIFRGRRFCSEILTLVSQQPELHGKVIVAEIEQDNIASIKCARRAGFVFQRDAPDDDGFVSLVFAPSGSTH